MPIIGHETWSIHHIRNIVHVSDVTGYLPAKGRGGGGGQSNGQEKKPLGVSARLLCLQQRGARYPMSRDHANFARLDTRYLSVRAGRDSLCKEWHAYTLYIVYSSSGPCISLVASFLHKDH